MPITIDGQTYYRTAEVFRMIGVSRNTLYRWLQKDVLGGIEHRDSRGWRLFAPDEIDKLNERDRKIMILRFGLRGVKSMTQKDVACLLGISQSYISRIEKKIIKKMRDDLQKIV